MVAYLGLSPGDILHGHQNLKCRPHCSIPLPEDFSSFLKLTDLAYGAIRLVYSGFPHPLAPRHPNLLSIPYC